MCTTSSNCAAGEICVDRFCVSEATPLDADTEQPDVGPGDAGQPRCTTPDCNLCADLHPGALLCENFDDELDLPWVPVSRQGGTTTVDTSRFIAGGASLHAVAPLGGDGFHRYRLATPITSGELFGRVYVYFGPTTVVTDFTIAFDLADGTSDKLSVDFIAQGRLNLVRKNEDDSIREAVPLPIPLERWVCVEFQHRISEPGVDGLLALTVDGQLVDSLSPIATPAPATGFRNVSVGLRAGPMSSGDAFIDEFVLSTEGPIGCIP